MFTSGSVPKAKETSQDYTTPKKKTSIYWGLSKNTAQKSRCWPLWKSRAKAWVSYLHRQSGDTAYIFGVSTSQTARWAFLSISLLENMAVTLTTCIRFKKDLCPVALEFHSTAEVWYPVSSHCKNTSLFGKDITLCYGATVPKHWHFRDVHLIQPLQNLRSGVKTHV